MIYFLLYKNMPRGKKITPVIKRKATTTRKPRTSTTRRLCKTTRKRTGAVARRVRKQDIAMIDDIPEDLVPKENKFWKALKILFGVGAASGAVALGYLGYKNKDTIAKVANDIVKITGEKGKQSVEEAKKFVSKNWDAAKEMAANAYEEGKKYANNAYDASKKYAYDTWAKGKAFGKKITRSYTVRKKKNKINKAKLYNVIDQNIINDSNMLNNPNQFYCGLFNNIIKDKNQSRSGSKDIIFSKFNGNVG